jgi:preprotein translocase subunit SecE
MKKIIQFFKESVAELKKVVWPTKDDIISSTKIVIVSTVMISIVLGAVDFLLYQGMKFLFRIG